MSYTQLKCKNVIGRKEYSCSWCNETILIGEKHQSRAGIFDGEFSANREHDECAKAMMTMNHNELADGYTLGEFKRGTIDSY